MEEGQIPPRSSRMADRRTQQAEGRHGRGWDRTAAAVPIRKIPG